jgi:hypothetical protein
MATVILNTLEQFATDYREAVKAGNAPPDYGTPVDVHAIAGKYGTAILVEFPPDNGDPQYLSPFFNTSDSEGDCYGQHGGQCGAPEDCEFGWCGSDRFQVELDADEWLDSMAGAANWSEFEWIDSSPSMV